MIDLNDETEFILGMPNFKCGHLAAGLRLLGYAIPHQAEKEQAYVIHHLLGLYEEHGDGWRTVLKNQLRAKRDEVADG